ncbi:MAG TPA: HlyD family efflux transporter periplasmic adaptor subunit [Candidatus Acidoferrales bacterium]|nr:HlyD family efflux transporter periplasmic adaptor subunit [Candidatus Acidoferrales bacterium]
MTQTRAHFASLTVWLLAVAWLASCSAQGKVRSSDPGVPVAPVKQGDVQLRVNATGELHATHTAMMTAPAIAGGSLQIIRLLKAGSVVKTGDDIVDFDPSQQEFNLGQNRSDLEQADQEIVKARDDAAVQAAQDQTALLKDQFDVRQAELEVSKNELVSAIDAQKANLTLEEAKRALTQLQQDIKSHAASGLATIAVDEEKAHKAKLAMDQALENIKNMQVHSPIAGLVVIRQNQSAAGGFFFGGMTLPDFQQGDQVYPGSVIADVIDMDNMEITAHVSESDRVNVKAGQSVEIHVDALPGVVLTGTVKNLAATAGYFFDSGGGSSDVSVALNHPDKLLRPGFTAHVVILGDDVKKALWIAREAIFEKDGKQIVYAQGANGFEPRSVQIKYLTEGVAVIDGLKVGTEVAVIDPSQKTAGSAKPAAAGPVGAPR